MKINNELINRIEVNESQLNDAIHWMAHGKDNGCNEDGINQILRYLLKQTVNTTQKAQGDDLTEYQVTTFGTGGTYVFVTKGENTKAALLNLINDSFDFEACATKSKELVIVINKK